MKHVVEHRMAIKSLATSDWDAVINECSKAEQWLEEKMQLQNSLPKNADPTLWSNEIRRMIGGLDLKCRRILRPRSFPAKSGEVKGADRASTDDSMPAE